MFMHACQGANRMLHEEFAEFFNRKYPSVIPDRAAFVAQMAEMYNRQFDLTLGSLAAGLANFEVRLVLRASFMCVFRVRYNVHRSD
jgi:hypothetical protein